jgi:hypothetical protein
MPYVPPQLKAPRPKVMARGQDEDEPAPAVPAAAPAESPQPPVAKISMPGPGALGVRVEPAAFSWTAALARLETLGMTGFQVRELPEGGWRFSCQLRTAQPGRRQRIETGPAASKAEAIRLAVVEAEHLSQR